jgi:hypothetical protein
MLAVVARKDDRRRRHVAILKMPKKGQSWSSIVDARKRYMNAR